MHDRYQRQTPLNEAPLNGNTIIPPGAQEERQDCFSSFLSVLINVGGEPASRRRPRWRARRLLLSPPTLIDENETFLWCSLLHYKKINK